MVDVVQLVEHQVVILAVAGSSPVIHPDMMAPGSASSGPGAIVVSGPGVVAAQTPACAIRVLGRM